MKLAVPNLKTLDYKQLGIDHGEKLAIAIIGLLLLFVMYSTRWKQPISESPTELVNQATTADETIKKQAWPEAEIKVLKTGTDLNARANALLTPLDVSAWLLPIPLNKPYHPDRTLISRPKWLAVKELMADAQVADLEMDPRVARLDEGFRKLKKDDKPEKAKKGDKKEKEAEEKPDEPEDLKKTAFGGGGGAGGKGIGGLGGFGMGGLGGKGLGLGRGKRGKDPGERVENKGKRSGRRRKKAADDDTDEKATKEVEKPVGRGYHLVAVRGVFPLREQVAEMRRAMGNAVSPREAQEAIQLHDFKLERQTAKSGPEPWSGPWEPVDREATLEMFHNDIYSFAPESVSGGIVDNHICMPLPIRLVGEWGKIATHPAVKQFVLSPDEIQTQLEYQRKVIEKMEQDAKKLTDKIDKGGFAEFTNNPRKVQKRGVAEAEENNKPIQQQILDDLAKAPKDRPSEEAINAKLTDFIAKHATPQDHLLLFRYVDFNVEPGKIYRYRAKLVVDNPFKNRHAEEVSDPSLIEGDYRETDWSEPTRPVYVPEDARFFVAHADARPGRSSLPNAEVDLFQWFASTGTVVNHPKVHVQIGQLIGGLLKARVLNPAIDTADDEKVPFSTNDALIDVAPGFSLEPGLHHDLISEIAASDTKDKSEPKEKKPAAERERKGGNLVPDLLVFVDENGALRVIDALDQEEDHQIAKHRYDFQNDQWQELTKTDDEKGGKLGARNGKRKRGGGGPGLGIK
jgi:hypothetical protein